MAGWRIVETECGRAAYYGAFINGLPIKAAIHENDGDAVEWYVRENDEDIASGIIFPENGPTQGKTMEDETWAWNEAKRLAEDAICYPQGLPRIMWPEKKNELNQLIASYLLSKCDEIIKQYENKILEELEEELSGI